jgi:hypothetical protein
MANFTLETTRNTAFQNIPRLIFQLPQSTTGATTSMINPILFCQNGCNIEFNFKNITSAKMKNDGTYFIIIPPDNTDNYINWNGTNKDGFDMIRFDLKEIRFSAPAKDVVGSINYNKSIQMYFSFVNSEEKNRDIMIVISIIGQANNVGNIQTDGFILLNALADQIPTRNDVKTVTNLKNVNLGNLLPPTKAFFNTLINSQSINYISMAKIIDIPDKFLNNIISRVTGGTDAYKSKVNQYIQQIPSNPDGTVILYSENIRSFGSNEAIVCNANCDRVIGDSKLLQPIFGSSSTTRGAAGAPSARTASSVFEAPKEEICEEEFVYPGTKTAVAIKSANDPAVSSDPLSDKSNQKELTSSEWIHGIVISVFIFIIFCSVFGMGVALAKATDISGIRAFFSPELWNKSNIGLIIAALIAVISIIVFTSIALDIMIKNNKVQNWEENDINKNLPWIYIITGYTIYILCLIPFIIIFVRNKKNSYKSITSNSYRTTDYEPKSFKSERHFELPINKNLPDIKSLTSKTNSLLSKYDSSKISSPSEFFKKTPSELKEILNASKAFSKLSNSSKKTLEKYNPSIAQFLKADSTFIQNIKESIKPGQNYQLLSDDILKNFIESVRKYNLMTQKSAIIDTELINKLIEHQIITKDEELLKIINKLKLNLNNPIPPELYEYISRM